MDHVTARGWIWGRWSFPAMWLHGQAGDRSQGRFVQEFGHFSWKSTPDSFCPFVRIIKNVGYAIDIIMIYLNGPISLLKPKPLGFT